ncbi:MAG: hypothetical protein J6M94_03635 [Prevotella sp.]|nr:hypothetical protein [Prevotella sp.]
MLYLIVALIVLGIFSAILGLLSHNKKGESSVILADSSSCSTCNGDDPKCEQLCMMEAATREIEYFDDEELDRYKGRQGNQYTDDEAEEFRNVMLTMQQNEVSAWSRSLTLRGIEVPYQVKDELLMLMEH